MNLAEKITLRNIGLLATALSISVTINGQVKSPILSGKEKTILFEKQMEMSQASPFKDLKWQFIGPSNISGRCTDVEAISPRGKSYTIWIGSATGGVWKSANEGTTFVPVFESMPTASIGDIAIDPNNPDVVWVGTGEANIFRSSNAGCGVFKTIDGGKIWNQTGLENTFTIGRIRVNPKNSDIVYVAATGHEWTPNKERGLFKTTDGGKNWSNVLYVDENTGVNDLVLDPKDPNTLYCTTWERIRLKWNDPRTYDTTLNNGIWKSSDGGKGRNLGYDFSTPFRIFGSIQDHGSYYGVVDLSRGRDRVPVNEFKDILGGEGTSHTMNPVDNNTVYASNFYGTLARAELNKYPQGTKNLLPQMMPEETPLRGEWVAPTLISTHNPDIIYHGMQYLMMSKDKGNTWEIISPDLSCNYQNKMGFTWKSAIRLCS